MFPFSVQEMLLWLMLFLGNKLDARSDGALKGQTERKQSTESNQQIRKGTLLLEDG
jgi:hypothetical protein